MISESPGRAGEEPSGKQKSQKRASDFGDGEPRHVDRPGCRRRCWSASAPWRQAGLANEVEDVNQ